MIKFSFIFALFAYLFLFGKRLKLQPNLKINVEYTHTYDGQNFKCRDSGKLHEIKVMMINNGPDSLEYWMMSCSRSDYFITNSSTISFCTEMCRSNYPELIKLAPFQRDSFYMSLSAKSEIDSSFKIGFVLLDGKELQLYWSNRKNIIKEKVKANGIIWTNQIGSSK